MLFTILFLVCFTYVADCRILNYIEYAMEDNDVVPKIIPVAPPQELHVFYPSGLIVTPGAVTHSFSVEEAPDVSWTCPPPRFNMMAMIDVDEPVYGHTTGRERILWLVVNIEANDLSSGETLIEYAEPFPRSNDFEPHRYVVLVYEQPWILGFNVTKIDRRTIEGRDDFSMLNFSIHYRLQNPIAGTVFFVKLF